MKDITNKLVEVPEEEAKIETQKYFKGDKIATNSWINKYALKDSTGKLYEKSPEEMHWRLANEIARIELKYKNPLNKEEVYNLIKDFKYIIPQGGPMTGIGNNLQISSLSNCFVIGADEKNADSYSTILKIDAEQIQLMKRRGGVGHDLSGLRPVGSPVHNSALTSAGIVPFMERYSNSTKEVAQGGRRGALMLSISVKHPEAHNFIDAKLKDGKVTSANISVKINDGFMNAIKNNEKYTQQFPIDSDTSMYTKEIDAKELWNKIIHNAWEKAEPGVLFWDTIMRESIPDVYAEHGFKTVSTNPCGEIPLCPYDSCRLLSMNLYSYVENPFTKDATFNNELFKKHAHYAQRIMDDIIDLELEKIDGILNKIKSDPEDEETKVGEIKLWEKIKEKAIQGRRSGIGVTAEGDMIAAMGFTYGTKEATDFATEVHKTYALEVYRSSVNLAEERGKFPIYDSEKEKNNPFIKRIKEADPELYKKMEKVGRRNIALLTIAPTGTTSLMTQTTSGIEPVFLVNYRRRRRANKDDKNLKKENLKIDKEGETWEEYNIIHPKFKTWLEINGYNSEEVEKYTEEELNELIKKSPYYKATSNDIDWVEKVRMQGQIQKWVDHSISVTVNLPKEATEELVSKVYQTAWESGCKGCTIYRDGSREGILSSGKDEKGNSLERKAMFPNGRPEIVDADVQRFKNTKNGGKEGEDWIAFIGKNSEGKPFEIFTGKPEGAMLHLPITITKGQIKKVKKNDGTSRYDFIYMNEVEAPNMIGGISHNFNKEYWNYARLTSGLLNEGTPVVNVIKIVEKLYEDNEGFNTWKKGVVRALKNYVPDGTKKGVECEICQQPIRFENGCETCGCGGKCG